MLRGLGRRPATTSIPSRKGAMRFSALRIGQFFVCFFFRFAHPKSCGFTVLVPWGHRGDAAKLLPTSYQILCFQEQRIVKDVGLIERLHLFSLPKRTKDGDPELKLI